MRSPRSTRVLRGDRIGLVGPNGAGKTTMIRLLLGDLAPDAGEIQRGTNVEVAYFDQQREQLDPERSVVDTVADGSDQVTVGGVTRHVYGYLEDFLFPPERARSPVKALSGGERNRLLLARLLTRPSNVLVLDEPTNDLDIETLELVEAQLVAFPGTLLIVSHDRQFLNNVVTSIWAFEGDGRIEEYVGGYDDWLRQRAQDPEGSAGRGIGRAGPAPPKLGDRSAPAEVGPVLQGAEEQGPASPKPRAPRAAGGGGKKLSFKEQREFDALPAQIDALTAERERLRAVVASADFYREPAATIKDTLGRLEAADAQLDRAYERWTELEARVK